MNAMKCLSSTSMMKGDHTSTEMGYVNGKMHWRSAVLIILISKLQLYLNLELRLEIIHAL